MDAEAHEQKRAPEAGTWPRTGTAGRKVVGWSLDAELIRIGEGRPLSVEERAHVLNTALPGYLSQHNGRIIGRSDRGVTVAVPQQRINHVLHLLLTVFTLGLWAPFWAVMGYRSQGDELRLITVDETGGVTAVPVDQ